MTLGGVTGPDAADSAVWRAASRVEVHIEGLLDQYDEVRRVKPRERRLPCPRSARRDLPRPSGAGTGMAEGCP